MNKFSDSTCGLSQCIQAAIVRAFDGKFPAVLLQQEVYHVQDNQCL
jgi:hypothetical protein